MPIIPHDDERLGEWECHKRGDDGAECLGVNSKETPTCTTCGRERAANDHSLHPEDESYAVGVYLERDLVDYTWTDGDVVVLTNGAS